ncbi:MAG: membrane protein insertase YidC [Zoogloeaceae bacterium]|jgi:YidC/Oxa1 family membrane protein insertase|nr:membrane protein insertase YidC [Zoogloeaceae bacterium]
MDIRRLALLFVFMFSLMTLWSAWQREQNPPAAAPPPAAANASSIPAASTSSASSAPASADAQIPQPSSVLQQAAAARLREEDARLAAPLDAPPAESLFVETDLARVEISTLGGDLVWLELQRFRAQDDKSKRFTLFDDKHRYAAQSGLIGDGMPNHLTSLTPIPGPRALAEGEDTLEVRLAAPEANGVRATKVFTFHRNSYLIDVAWEIENASAAPVQAEAYFQLQRDDAAPVGDSFMLATFYGVAVYTEAEKYQKVSYKEVAENEARFTGKTENNGWLAMVQHYFVSAWAPQGDTLREFYMRRLGDASSNLFAAGVMLPAAVVAPGETRRVSMPLFAGPQEQAALKQVAPGLELVVDYGRLHIIAAPIFWVLEFINTLIGNWGWSIVVLTILIKLLFYPLSATSYKSMAKMRTLTPKLMQLKERHGSDKARLNQEMMKLYQSEKVNPLGGCLPILVQIPVFIALYWVLLGAVEMRDAPWIFWIKDLSAADPYYVLPIIMMISMFIQTRLNPTPPDPIQAKMMLIMPLVFGVMFFFFPAGLVLYWVVNNILSIAQQWQINWMLEKGGVKKAANDPVIKK